MDNRDTSGNASYPTLKATMEDSCFAIVVLSGKYADSTRSLDELEMICECMNTGQDRIFPVFDQVEPAGYHASTMFVNSVSFIFRLSVCL